MPPLPPPVNPIRTDAVVEDRSGFRSCLATTHFSAADRPFHSPRWMKVIEESFDIKVSAAVLERSGKHVSGVAWSSLDDLFGSRRVSLPYSDYSDIIATMPGDCISIAADYACLLTHRGSSARTEMIFLGIQTGT